MKLYKKTATAFFATLVFLGAIFFISFKTKTLNLSFDNSSIKSVMVDVEERPDAENLLERENETKNVSPLSGIECINYNRRGFAVMISGDQITRPLSGLSQADMVWEMPVITGSITRYMAVFICEDPVEIGSVRSARHDFIPLAAGVDAIFVHWGGSHFAIDRLKNKILDNMDALSNPYRTFYRKPDAPPPPHDGFTSMGNMKNAAEKLGYRMENNFSGYEFYSTNEIIEQKKEFLEKQLCAKTSSGCSVVIGYQGNFRVKFPYDFESNLYLRERGSSPEMDRNTKTQIKAKNIVVMVARSRQIEGQYNDVELEGRGEAFVFQNGRKIEAMWQKDKTNINSKLLFLDGAGQEIKFVPGQTWFEIVENENELKSDFK